MLAGKAVRHQVSKGETQAQEVLLGGGRLGEGRLLAQSPGGLGWHQPFSPRDNLKTKLKGWRQGHPEKLAGAGRAQV